MIKILVCCGGGFSSSFMARNVTKGIKENNLEGRVEANFIPFSHVFEIADDYDIAFLCPHLRYQVKEMMEKHGDKIHIPLSVIAPKMYGTMRVPDLLSDAVELIEIYQKNPYNPTCFPDEADGVPMDRTYSHRVTVDKKKNDIEESLAYFEKYLNVRNH